PPCVDHRLDGDDVAGLQQVAGAGIAVVRHLRGLVHVTPDPVADVLAHHREPVGLDVGLDGGSDVTDVVAGLCRGDASVERLAGHVDQASHLGGRLAAGDGQSAASPPAPVHEAAVPPKQVRTPD